MITTVEAIYEQGVFRPVSDVPAILKERDRVRITIDTDSDDLSAEIDSWEQASDEDFVAFESRLEELS